MTPEQQQKAQRIKSLLLNTLISNICQLVRARLLNKKIVKKILCIEEITNLANELRHELK